MNDKEEIIRKIIRKESLRMIKESQASFLKEDVDSIERTMEDVDDSIIEVNEKKLEKLNNEEKAARDSEDFSELKRIKEEQVAVIERLVFGYSKKTNLLEKIKTNLEEDLLNIATNGAGVFKNQEINEFNNDSFQKGWGLKIETPNTSTDLVKIADHNAYKVMKTNIPGLEAGMLLQLPELKLGGAGKVAVFTKREGGSGYENSNNFTMENITNLVKNPQ